MRIRFHEPRSDVASHRRLYDVSANKSLYGNKRETPSIRCHESANRTRGLGAGGTVGGGASAWVGAARTIGSGGTALGRRGARAAGRSGGGAPWAARVGGALGGT